MRRTPPSQWRDHLKIPESKPVTHTGPMNESEGKLGPEGRLLTGCRGKCAPAATAHTVQEWDSNDGAYEDVKFTCAVCKHVFWAEGIDS